MNMDNDIDDLLYYKQKFIDIYNHSPHGYITIRENLSIESVNSSSAFLLGGEIQSFVDRSILQFIAPDSQSAFSSYISSIVAYQARESINVNLVNSSGDLINANIIGIYDKNAHIIITLVGDQERTNYIDAAVEMAAALAHEINQPLAAINVYSQACLKQYSNELNHCPRVVKALEKIATLSKHAGLTLYRMKNFMRKGEILPENTDINELIKQAISLLDRKRSEEQYKFTLDLGPNLPLILLDRIKIIQVILNLVQNSIEALDDKNKEVNITISTIIRNDMVEVSVSDNGPGIPAEIINRIMQTNFTTKTHGAGLGLPICRALIEAHGGELIIKAPTDTGASISFYLPVNNEELAHVAKIKSDSR